MPRAGAHRGVRMLTEEEYEKLMATLERIEKAGTLADIVRTAPDPSWEDTALTMPTIYGEDSFERIHRRGLTNMAFALQRLEKEAGMVKYLDIAKTYMKVTSQERKKLNTRTS